MRHHYVPQFYLRQWYLPEKRAFWLYCRDDTGKISSRYTSAKSIAFREGLYSTLPEGLGIQRQPSHEIEEKFFGHIDSAASQVHKKILTSGITDLSTEDRLAWSLFVNSLLERSPARIDEIKRSAKDDLAILHAKWKERLLHSSAESSLSRRWERLDIDASTQNAALSAIMTWIKDERVVQYFSDMDWSLIHQPMGNDHFLTSDSPVVINAGAGESPIHFLSLALSPTILLVMHTRDGEFDEEFLRTLAACHSVQILQQTRLYLVSSEELLDNGHIKYRKALNEIFSRP